ncbi:MAG TPA: hypothetical protein VLX32_06345 [Candidatus Acidoferrum sp.]|nr:hypothetical protein [Candidatus Acidoferrum sp.]
MSAEASHRALGMTLPQLVDRYIYHALEFGTPVPLSSFGLGLAETQRVFSAFDEDYHISRFLHFSEENGIPISINGIPATHVSLDSDIQSIL